MSVYNLYDNLFIEKFLFGLLRPHKLKVYGNSFIPRKENRCGLSYYGNEFQNTFYIYTCTRIYNEI